MTADPEGVHAKTGIYILVGYKAEDDDLPTIHIGQAAGESAMPTLMSLIP